ncbi:separin [Sitophilus oryzae]|uniref:separase n=1 Tax=Sitophilus oryzae TaxID=7048 RepID=A0A6J2Y0A4_SITOR|nr:separin [Sitophilus oryzae]
MEGIFSTREDILKELDTMAGFNHTLRSGLFHQRSQKFKAGFWNDEELSQIYCLVDSHVPTLRERTAMRYERLLAKEELNDELTQKLKFLKNIIYTKCFYDAENRIKEILNQVAEMPKEWTLVQLTSQQATAELENINMKKYETSAIHITVFDCGQDKTNPFTVKVDKPHTANDKIELLQELMSLVNENRDRLTNVSGLTRFKNYEEKMKYSQSRDRVDESMNMLVKKIETIWLGEFRCLLIGKYQDVNIEEYIRKEIDSYLEKENFLLVRRQKEILYKFVKGSNFLSSNEMLNAVEYCVNDNTESVAIKKLCDFMKTINRNVNSIFKNKLRHPVILIVDECLDCVPWEMMKVIENEPISRLPSLHFVYLLYKTHEKDIENGHKVIRNYSNGSYIVNPDKNLETMENRMTSFYKYWMPEWNGISGQKPGKDEFIQMLTESEIFSYNGHGNGAHLMSVDALQRKYVQTVVMLFGCASTRINKLGPQTEMYGSYHMYLISRCPCVVGMLWEVTDVDTDVLTVEFISSWVPSKAPIHWANLNKTNWTKGKEKKINPILTDAKENKEEFNNPELLRALCHSKNSAKYFMTKAACVVRGLPVKIKEN